MEPVEPVEPQNHSAGSHAVQHRPHFGCEPTGSCGWQPNTRQPEPDLQPVPTSRPVGRIENIDQQADAKYTKNDKLWFRRYANDLTYAYAPKVQTPLQPEGYKITVFPMKRATEKRIPSPNLPQLRKAITSTALFSIGIACPIKKM